MLSQREVPRINGSTSAFIALVVILVLIIIIACSATIYLLREDMAEDTEAPTREVPSRGRYQLSGSQAVYQKFSRNWSDKPRTASGQGWFKAGNGSDWDSPSQNKKYSNSMRMTEQDASSMSTPRSSNVGSFPGNQFYSSMSEASSSVRFDPHAIRGLSYGDPSTHPSRSIIPSIHSHMYSPPSSPPLSPTPHGSSRAALASSPEPMERSLSYDSSMDNDSSSTTHPRPPIRTFEGGTKFIEGL
ncbi:hypothetical protein CPB84DRAFT_1151391 [Gymnopilus junonius]|uniref:Uncharacterized protein n=1 Tax=Gymnopilus junonius TaxID=109634 RepID=A0A9P5NLJ8_GYMJU|nr:hypothetical protein CPB84DRAFT_1151391 [Gymnopilus junonius]